MAAVQNIAPWDTIAADEESLTSGFIVLDPMRPYNQLEQMFVICWPYQRDAQGKYPATCFSTRSNRTQLRKLRDAVNTILDTQADLMQHEVESKPEDPDAVG